MDTANTIEEARKYINAAKKKGKKIGFVPTMGFLHQGHLSLVEISNKHTGYQVMSIFVNKIQFNDPNDFSNYPRELQRDLDMAEKIGVDLVFMPEDSDMYNDHLTYVDVETLTNHLCGGHRPGHFKGVFTVVSKLFNIIQPDVAVFGQKDIQQAIGIEKMVYDLNFPLKIILAPIIREKEGLAMSSRNKHLSNEQKKNAVVIHKSLQKAEEMINSGEINCKILYENIYDIIKQGTPDKIDYISIVDYNNLHPVETLTEKSVIAIAVFFGETRLIDNMVIEKGDDTIKCIY